jgi:predicted branched-subunit amino acid permease
MDFVVALTFIGVLAPLLRDRAMAAAAVSGGLTSVFLVLPLKLNLMAAALIGAAVGIAMETGMEKEAMNASWPKSRSGA